VTQILRPKFLNKTTFAPFGDVIEASGPPDLLINQDLCGRYHDLANLDAGTGRLGISLFDAQPRDLPLDLEMMERHPLGSQAFLPMHKHPYLVIVADDAGNAPATPLRTPGLFAVIDRIGEGDNLEEHWFASPWRIEAS